MEKRLGRRGGWLDEGGRRDNRAMGKGMGVGMVHGHGAAWLAGSILNPVRITPAAGQREGNYPLPALYLPRHRRGQRVCDISPPLFGYAMAVRSMRGYIIRGVFLGKMVCLGEAVGEVGNEVLMLLWRRACLGIFQWNLVGHWITHPQFLNYSSDYSSRV